VLIGRITGQINGAPSNRHGGSAATCYDQSEKRREE